MAFGKSLRRGRLGFLVVAGLPKLVGYYLTEIDVVFVWSGLEFALHLCFVVNEEDVAGFFV